MMLQTSPQRVSEPVRPVRAPAAPRRRPRRNRRLILALLLVSLAGFLLGLSLPTHP